MDKSLNIKQNPHTLLLFATIALLLALAFRPLTNVDFKDISMYSIPLDSMVWIIPLLLISLWLIYSVTRKYLYSKTIMWIHVLTTVITILCIVASVYILISSSPYLNDQHELIGDAIQVSSILFILGQLSYIANILLGLFRRHTTQ